MVPAALSGERLVSQRLQRHYIASARDDQGLDPQFKSPLKRHWMEEAQQAKLDTHMVQALTQGRDPREIETSVEEYLEIGSLIDAGLKQQVEDAIAAKGRRVASARCSFTRTRWKYLASGMTHERVLATLAPASLLGTSDRGKPYRDAAGQRAGFAPWGSSKRF